MKISMKRIKNATPIIFKPKGRTGSRNAINKTLFEIKMIEKGLRPKSFAEEMNGLGFDSWKTDTVYRVTNGIRVVTIEEAQAMCSILRCTLAELFPELAGRESQFPSPNQKFTEAVS